MATAPVANDYADILTGSRPLIDVRAPAEFARGAFPRAVNLPLLTDDERAAVGTEYKRRGRQAAINLGHELVEGDVKRARVNAWRAFAAQHPDALIYCWRGGLRSHIVQTWLAEVGVRSARIAGGFKALRRYCLDVIERAGTERRFVLVGGRTGSGKTSVVKTTAAHIDLEGLANHRGSAFGGLSTPQPPPVAFENALAVALLKLPPDVPIPIEDESRTIGRLAIPEALFAAMQRAPIALLELDDDARAANIYREYVLEAAQPQEHLSTALARIERRLGGARFQEIKALMDEAFRADAAAAVALHQRWIVRLLKDYYDPMYDYQLAGKEDRVFMRGPPAEIVSALRDWDERCEGGELCAQH